MQAQGQLTQQVQGKQECIFCKIVKGEIPSYRIYDDSDAIAFLDINPATPGHSLVVPKKHSVNIFDVDADELARVMKIIKRVAEKIKSEMGTDSINIIQNNGRLSGQIVDHIHFHIIPRYQDDGVRISYGRYEVKPSDLEELAKKLKVEKKEEHFDPWRGY